MSADIIAKLGLGTEKFDRGLASAARGWESFGQKLRSKPVQIVPEKSAADSARVFEDIARAREKHIGGLDSDRIDRALSAGAGAVGTGGKSAADSAAVFEKSLRNQEQQTQDLTAAQEALSDVKKRTAYDEANTVGRIKIVQGELVTLAKQRDAAEKGTVDRLRTEVQIEERLARLRGLQRSQAAQTIPVLPRPEVVERQAGGLLTVIRRKFGSADALRGTLGAFGLGGIAGIAQSVTSFFSREADRSQGKEQLSTGNADNLKNTLSTLGGMATRVRLNQQEFKALESQIEITRVALESLDNDPRKFADPFGIWNDQIMKLDGELNGLLAKQNALGNEQTLLTRELAYQKQLYADQVEQLENITRMRKMLGEASINPMTQNAIEGEFLQKRHAAEKARGSEAERASNLAIARNKAERVGLAAALVYRETLHRHQMTHLDQVEKLRARGEHNELSAAREQLRFLQARSKEEKRHSLESYQANERAIKQTKAQIKELEREATAKRGSLAQSLTTQAVSGTRTFANGQPRPRSETERLADRAARERQQANDAVLTGQPQLARDSLRSAKITENTVAGRLSNASRLVAGDQKGIDPTALKGALVDTNKILSAIQTSLKPMQVK